MNMQKEPAIIIGLISAFVTAALALLVAFGLPISDEIQNAILGAIGPVILLVTSGIIRGKVYAPASVETAVPGTKTV